ncbi:MAG: DUF401 family protein [Firmicutes bacterium]|nr:DUF401 family protein [Bacillota bacterium]
MEIAVIIKLLIVIGVLLAFVFLKQKPEIALAVSSVLLILIYGKGLQGFADAFTVFIKDKNTWTLPAAVLLIAILSGVMGKTGMLQKMIEKLKHLTGSTKLTIILAPLLIGLLAVTGGAYVSCPLVDELGNSLGISKERKAAINLVYRHAVHFSYPLNGSVIVIANLGNLNIGRLCLVMLPVVVWVFVIGYVLLLRDVKDVKLPRAKGSEFRKDLGSFLLNVFPILITLIFTVAGVMPMIAALAIGIASAVVIANLQEDTKPKEGLFDLIFKKVNYKMVLVILAALFFKACISSVPEISAAMTGIAAMGLPPEVIILVIAMLTSFPTGSVQTPAAIIIPMMLSLTSDPNAILLYTGLVLASSIYGYFFSPVHMCQLLTCEYFETGMAKLMKEYKYFIPLFAVGIAAWYIIMKLVLL